MDRLTHLRFTSISIAAPTCRAMNTDVNNFTFPDQLELLPTPSSDGLYHLFSLHLPTYILERQGNKGVLKIPFNLAENKIKVAPATLEFIQNISLKYPLFHYSNIIIFIPRTPSISVRQKDPPYILDIIFIQK